MESQMKRNFEFENGRFRFLDEDGSGWKDWQFGFNGQLSSQMPCVESDVGEKGGRAVLQGTDHRETLEFSVDAERQALVVSRRITNTGTRDLPFQSVCDGILDERGAVLFSGPFIPIDIFKLRYFHSSNIRTEKFPRFRVEYPYVRCIPYDPVHFNHDEANHLPAFGICCGREYETVLVEGDLNQIRFERSWELGLEGVAKEGRIGHCRGIQRYTLSNGFALPPGETVEVSRVFYQLKRHASPQTAFDDYVEELGRHHDFRGPKTRMRREVVYCTWNYGVFGDIDEDNILKRAEILAKRIPNCTHFLIDSGYQAQHDGYGCSGIDSFYPVPAKAFDKGRFPHGMRFISDGIRALGLKPCIWLSPKLFLASPLAREKPEWVLKDKDGSNELIGESSFLDLSNPEARAYYLEVLDALLVEWGFEGIKYDFMTQWFLMDKIRFRQGSGIEWRDFAFDEIRRRIGEDGFFMTCIAFGAGNPFPGLHADCYRAGFDIHEGTWAEQVRSCSGTLAQVLIEGGKTYLLNMDSAGFAKIPEHERIFRFNWCFITQGILEIGGKLEELTDEQFVLLNKYLDHADRGNKVVCLDERAFTGETLPEILQVKYTKSGPMADVGVAQHMACFNWSDRPKRISVSLEAAGIAATQMIADFWTGEPVPRSNGFLSFDLPSHASVLVAVRGQAADGRQA